MDRRRQPHESVPCWHGARIASVLLLSVLAAMGLSGCATVPMGQYTGPWSERTDTIEDLVAGPDLEFLARFEPATDELVIRVTETRTVNRIHQRVAWRTKGQKRLLIGFTPGFWDDALNDAGQFKRDDDIKAFPLILPMSLLMNVLMLGTPTVIPWFTAAAFDWDRSKVSEPMGFFRGQASFFGYCKRLNVAGAERRIEEENVESNVITRIPFRGREINCAIPQLGVYQRVEVNPFDGPGGSARLKIPRWQSMTDPQLKLSLSAAVGREPISKWVTVDMSSCLPQVVSAPPAPAPEPAPAPPQDTPPALPPRTWDPESVAVADLAVSALESGEARTLADKIHAAVVESDYFRVLSRNEMNMILEAQKFQRSGACDDSSCLVEMGKILAVQKVIGGGLGKVGRTFSLVLRLVDVETGQVLLTVSKEYRGEPDALLGIVDSAVRELGVKYARARE